MKIEHLLCWSQLTVDFMTEESDNDDDGNLLVVHQLQWRSKSMCNNFSAVFTVCKVELIHANYFGGKLYV